MALNSSVTSGSPVKTISTRILIVQVSIAVFLSINFLLISTFFRKDTFYTTMRYILFAVTLLADCLFLIMSNALLVSAYFNFTMQIWLCCIVYTILSVYALVTPITLTVMSLERYVAICMPLRHAELCTMRGAVQLILIIHSISAVPCTVNLSIFSATVSSNLYSNSRLCFREMFVLFPWQDHLNSAMNQFYFLIMLSVIIFSYVQIMKAAKAASGENKKSTWKGLRTVILHAFQLLLCLIQLWCPFVEDAVYKIDMSLHRDIRYFNYVTFSLASRCLSPLIYGLRDELFFQALKSYAFCRLYRKSPV